MRSFWRTQIRGTLYHLQRGHGVPLKVEGTGVSSTQTVTFQWEKHKNKVFHVLVSKYMQILYLMLFILMKAMPRCTLTPITNTKLHIVVTKMAKTLDFWFWRFFAIVAIFGMTSVMTSQSSVKLCWEINSIVTISTEKLLMYSIYEYVKIDSSTHDDESWIGGSNPKGN